MVLGFRVSLRVSAIGLVMALLGEMESDFQTQNGCKGLRLKQYFYTNKCFFRGQTIFSL